jgi:hypothetical protein
VSLTYWAKEEERGSCSRTAGGRARAVTVSRLMPVKLGTGVQPAGESCPPRKLCRGVAPAAESLETPGKSGRGVGEAATPRVKATGWVSCRRGGRRTEGEGRQVGAAPTRRLPHRGRRSLGGCHTRKRTCRGRSGRAEGEGRVRRGGAWKVQIERRE